LSTSAWWDSGQGVELGHDIAQLAFDLGQDSQALVDLAQSRPLGEPGAPGLVEAAT
jgi:hypothetical protein